MNKKPKIRKNELTPFDKIVYNTWKKNTDNLIKLMEKIQRQNATLIDKWKSMIPEKPIDLYPFLRIDLCPLIQAGGEELYIYLSIYQDIEINNDKNYLQDRGVGNEFYDEENSLYLMIKREDLKDEKSFEKKMDEFFHNEFGIDYYYLKGHDEQ